MRSSRLRAIGGVSVSIVALLLVIRGVDLQATANVLRSADFRWIGLGAMFAWGDLAFRGLRWQRLVHPIKAVSYLPMLGYLLIGYLMNNVLPARLGELVRSHYLGDREGISRASALGTVVVERVVDLVAVVTIASASLGGRGPAPGRPGRCGPAEDAGRSAGLQRGLLDVGHPRQGGRRPGGRR